MVYYTYEIQCNTTNKRYIGSRITANRVDILDGYYTSSKVVALLIEKHGIDNFSVIGTKLHDTQKEAIKYENILLLNAKNNRHKYLNINFSSSVNGAVIKTQSHIKITNTKTNECIYYPKNVSLPKGWIKGTNCKPPSRKGFKTYYNTETGITQILGPHDDKVGYVQITAYKKLLKNKMKSQRGIRCVWITNGTSNTKIYKDEKPRKEWWFGKTSKATKHIITNGYESKWTKRTDEIPDGWKKGKHYKTFSTKGMIRITDGLSNKMINSSEKVPEGWFKGKASKKIYIYDNVTFLNRKLLLEYLNISANTFNYNQLKNKYDGILVVKENI